MEVVWNLFPFMSEPFTDSVNTAVEAETVLRGDTRFGSVTPRKTQISHLERAVMSAQCTGTKSLKLFSSLPTNM